ncbi:MAG: BON domain-containing protein [Acidobacteria bacterium]|nr:BON domain-containing protein [Acidobacteriota bacterium]
MKKMTIAALVLSVFFVATACTSLNQVTPAQWDDEAIEAEVRAKIAEDVPEKTFAVEVDVDDGVVYLDGHAESRSQARLIADAANDVEGVKRVVNRIHVE